MGANARATLRQTYLSEFKLMRRLLFNMVQRKPHVSVADAWHELLLLHAAAIPHMFQFVYIMLCVPSSSACVERGFSVHKCVKTRLSNRLQIITMDSLMRVKVCPALHCQLSRRPHLAIAPPSYALRCSDRPANCCPGIAAADFGASHGNRVRLHLSS